jgi:hypothetical protein
VATEPERVLRAGVGGRARFGGQYRHSHGAQFLVAAEPERALVLVGRGDRATVGAIPRGAGPPGSFALDGNR